MSKINFVAGLRIALADICGDLRKATWKELQCRKLWNWIFASRWQVVKRAICICCCCCTYSITPRITITCAAATCLFWGKKSHQKNSFANTTQSVLLDFTDKVLHQGKTMSVRSTSSAGKVSQPAEKKCMNLEQWHKYPQMPVRPSYVQKCCWLVSLIWNQKLTIMDVNTRTGWAFPQTYFWEEMTWVMCIGNKIQSIFWNVCRFIYLKANKIDQEIS